jgi:hypothetical protein
MSFGRKFKLSFQIVYSFILEAFSRRRGSKKIALTDRLYLRVPDPEPKLTLISLGGGTIISLRFSVDEAKQVFRSIKHACDLHDVVEIKVGDVSWETDARSPEKIIVVFKRSLEYTREIAKREDVVMAITEFTNRFGLE